MVLVHRRGGRRSFPIAALGGILALMAAAAPPAGRPADPVTLAERAVLPRISGERAIEIAHAPAAFLNETGTNDFRISDMGAVDGNVSFDAFRPDIAYNVTNNEYLVVWSGDDDTGALVDGEYEIFGQRINAATGAEIGSDFRISDMGFVDGDDAFGGLLPAVAYNTTDNEYLVVWYGDDDSGALVSGELEIRGQRLAGATGAEIGTNDFRISDMGFVDGNHAFDGILPVVAYNTTNNEYLVVWYGDDDTGALVTGEYEIRGQLLAGATGVEIGTNDFRISDMGAVDGNDAFDGSHPAVVFNATDNEYLVVWRGDDDTGALVDEEYEVFGQRIASVTGAEIGTNDFRISDMGAVDGSDIFGASRSDIAYNATGNEYLVVWHGDDDTGALVDDEHEIFGQRLAISYLDFFFGALLHSLPRPSPTPSSTSVAPTSTGHP